MPSSATWWRPRCSTSYRLVAAQAAPALWPADAPLRLALVAGLAGLGFAAATALLAFPGDPRVPRRPDSSGVRAVLAYVQAVVTVVALLWFAVAMG